MAWDHAVAHQTNVGPRHVDVTNLLRFDARCGALSRLVGRARVCLRPSLLPDSWRGSYTFLGRAVEPGRRRRQRSGRRAGLPWAGPARRCSATRRCTRGGTGGERALVNKLREANLFRKMDGRLKTAHHHASWHGPRRRRKGGRRAPRGAGPAEEGRGEDGPPEAERQRRRHIRATVLGIPAPKEEEPANRSRTDEDPGGMIGKTINLSDLSDFLKNKICFDHF